MSRTIALSCLVFLTACMSHERADDAGPLNDALPARLDAFVAPGTDAFVAPGPDATVATDAASRADAACVPGARPTLRFEPGLPMGGPVTFLGIDSEPSEDGVRIHLAACDGTCEFDLVVGHVGDGLARVGGASASATGTLDTDGASYAALHVIDARRCAGCGGTLDLLVGDLVSGRSEAIEVSASATRCSTGCGELREVTIATDGAELVLGQDEGGYSSDETLYARVSRAYHSPCVICDCAQPDEAASGVAAALTGIFVPSP
ncbi:MAG: hypothetical protein J0L92_18980 [Deltaproteobacteria bacterium]|nr:hypothetical protein [Deltaproteobacteria bacterium]